MDVGNFQGTRKHFKTKQMIMFPKTYIQFSHNNIPATRNLYDAWIGFTAMGYDVVPFQWNESVLSTDKLKDVTKQDIVCAGIPVYNSVLTHLGVKVPEPLDYPECFLKQPSVYLGRTINKTTLKEIRDEVEKRTLPTTFIKPVKQKQFTGFVVRTFLDMLKVVQLDDNTELYSSTPIKFLSEYRVYVNQNYSDVNDGILSIGHYNGNPTVFPNVDVIKDMIALYNRYGAPVAYSLDVGVVDNNKTVLVECNAFSCLGNYSCPSILYAKSMEAYWRSVVEK